jgi:4-amino-4-deoxy-L-arabinose transferase-like glycosyltransferase
MENTSSNNDALYIQKIRRYTSFFAIFLIIVGQIFQYSTRIDDKSIFPGPLGISILGILIFIAAQAVPIPKFVLRFVKRFPLANPISSLLLSFFLVLLSIFTMLSFQKIERISYIPVITFWLLSAVVYVTAFVNTSFSLPAIRSWIKIHRYELLTIGLVLLFAIAIRFYKLGEIPRVVNGDEGRIGQAAQATLTTRLANPFEYFENIGAFYLQLINTVFNLFGPSAFTLRLIPAICGVLAVLALYLWGRQIVGHRIAILAAFLLATSHTHIHFSRTSAVPYIICTLYISLELYFLYAGLNKRSSWRAAVGGVLLALHFNYYVTAQVVAVLILVYMIIAFIFARSWFKPVLKQALVFWGGAILVAIPQIIAIIQTPTEFFNRLNNDGTLQSGWLSQTMTSTGKSAIQVLVERVIHAFLSLIYYPTIDFYGSSIPMMSLITAALFLLGLVICLRRTKSPAYLLLNGSFWAFTLSIGLFSIPASADSYRMLIALPSALIMAAIGFDTTLTALYLGWSTSKSRYVVASGLILTSLLATNLWTYFGDFAGRCQYEGSPQGRFASFLGNYLHNVGREEDVFLLSNDLYFYGSHASVDFLSDNHPITNVKDPIDNIALSKGDIIIAPLDRMEELVTWSRSHPGGELHYQFDCKKPILLSLQVP